MIRAQREDPHTFDFFELHSHRDYLDDVGRLARARHKAKIYELIKTWQAAGAIRDEPHEVLRALVIGGFARLVREAAESPFPITDTLVQALERVAWDAIKK